MTRGVLVECAAIAQPELSVLDRNGAIQHLFTYSVEFSMLAESEQRDRHQPKVLSRAQLKSRHWRFRDAAGDYDDVEGEGVIGEYPILSPDDVEAFVYQSQARVMAPKDGSAPPPSMKGHFKFVEGTLNSPSGDIFDAVCGVSRMIAVPLSALSARCPTVHVPMFSILAPFPHLRLLYLYRTDFRRYHSCWMSTCTEPRPNPDRHIIGYQYHGYL